MVFARLLGASCLMGGLAIALWTILSSKSKGWRIFAAFAWFLGIALLLAAWNGICECYNFFLVFGADTDCIRPYSAGLSSPTPTAMGTLGRCGIGSWRR